MAEKSATLPSVEDIQAHHDEWVQKFREGSIKTKEDYDEFDLAMTRERNKDVQPLEASAE